MSAVATNRLVLFASIADVDVTRYTPAGVPALNFRLEHASEIVEAGQVRKVDASVKSVAFGAVAERLAKQAVGSHWEFHGFVATPRNGKHVVFHVQDFLQV